MESGDSTKKGKKMKRYIMKALSNFGDFYVKTMNGLARKMGGVSYCPPPSNIRVVALPRSFSASSSRVAREDQEFAELIKAAAALKLKKDGKINKNQNQNLYAGDGTMMKSSSDYKSDISFVKETVELFRAPAGSCLDTVYEEGELSEDDFKAVSPLMLTRSRSYGGAR